MPYFYIITVVFPDNETLTFEGQLRTLAGPIPVAQEKLEKRIKRFESFKEHGLIKDFSIDYES